MTKESGATTEGIPAWRRFWRFCFRIEPVRHDWWETLLFRIAVAYVAWDTLGGPSRFHSQPVPHGLAAWGVDFSWAGSEAIMQWFVPLISICLLLYIFVPLLADLINTISRKTSLRGALRWLVVLALAPPLFASIAHGTLGNSQGAIGHTTQIVTVALLAQWLALLWASIQGEAKLARGYNGQQLAADWTRQLIAASYVTSALTKLWMSKGDWLKETPYFGLQIAKATGQAYYQDLIPPDNAAWMGQFLIDHPLAAQAMIGIGLPLELCVFLGLHNRRTALFFGVALAAFHSGVTEIMHLGFAYHKILMLAFFANPVWWIVVTISSAFKRNSTQTA